MVSLKNNYSLVLDYSQVTLLWWQSRFGENLSETLLWHDCETTVKVQSATLGSDPFTLIYYEQLNLIENHFWTLLLDKVMK